ncbi:hypothetical protein ISS07_05175 [Candidatus Woesearchaeota archaeon]|nr:hypothetical protein [Candidatus Woesearchaeota archaeon]
MSKEVMHKVMSGVVVLIGLYMIVTSLGPISPPLLSGIAFVLIGARHLC